MDTPKAFLCQTSINIKYTTDHLQRYAYALLQCQQRSLFSSHHLTLKNYTTVIDIYLFLTRGH